MINPLTFESNGDNQYLTWARDSASVTDAITAARTSSPIFQSSADIRNLSVRQGSEVVYITDFRATITNNNWTLCSNKSRPSETFRRPFLRKFKAKP